MLRRNKFNGRLYKQDPTIYAYGLFNEPRYVARQFCMAHDA